MHKGKMTTAGSIILSFASFRSNLSCSILSNSSLWIALDKEWLHSNVYDCSLYLEYASAKVALRRPSKRVWILSLIKDFYGLLLN